MKLLHFIAFFSLSSIALCQSTNSEELLENLLTSENKEQFAIAFTKAKQANISEQSLLEARFIFAVDQQDWPALAALSPELEAASDKFDPKQSSIFSLKEDWLAIVQYTKALKALEKGNNAAFKSHITEAFWLSPRQASAFAPHIEKYRLDIAMAQLNLTSDMTAPNLLDSGKSALFPPNSKATILYFWSPWSREFSETLNDFKALCSVAKKHDIQVIAILAEQSNAVEKDARTFLITENIKNACQWSKDTADLYYSNNLRILSAPTVVLINNKRKVLFNGHPSNPEIWTKLKQLSPDLKKPEPKAELDAIE